MTPRYVIWEGNDGPSLHGPFESEDAAIQWAYKEGITFGLIEEDDEEGLVQLTDEAKALAWYDEEPNVWVRPMLAP